jgi:hypothetical protein
MSETQNEVLAGEVADTFILSGRPGVIVVPKEAWAVSIRVHDLLRLVKPHGETLLVKVGGIEMTNPPLPNGKCAILLMAEGISKDDAPIGSSLWLVQT